MGDHVVQLLVHGVKREIKCLTWDDDVEPICTKTWNKNTNFKFALTLISSNGNTRPLIRCMHYCASKKQQLDYPVADFIFYFDNDHGKENG